MYVCFCLQHDTTKKTKKQKEANIAQKKQMDLLQEQLTDKKMELADIMKVPGLHHDHCLK